MTIRNKQSLILFGSVLFCASAAMAEDEFDIDALYADDEFVSIATGSDKPIRLAPSVASVITAKDIQNAGANNIDEVLELVPGLHVSVSFNRLNTNYSIRGIRTKQTPQVLFLIDGVEINDEITGGIAPSFRLPVSSIKRIEVIRGPGSAIFGADAFSGVINIITKTAGDIDGIELGARVGSFDSRDSWFNWGSTTGMLKTHISLEHSRSDGDEDRVVVDGVGQKGPLETEYETFNGNLGVKAGLLDARFYWWEQKSAGVGPGSFQILDPQGQQDTQYYRLHLGMKELATGNDISSSFDFNYSHLRQRAKFTVLPAGYELAGFTFEDGALGNPGGDETVSQGEWATHFTGLDDHKFRLAVGAKKIDFKGYETKNFEFALIDLSDNIITDEDVVDVRGTPFIFLADKTRDVHWVSVQDEWAFASDWEVTAGLRYDKYSDFGTTWNPRVALVWAAQYNLTAKLLYGRAFRAPSLGELYQANNPVVLGNAELDAETIDTYELALDYRPISSMAVNINVFAYQSKDLIEFVFDSSSGTSMAQNVKNQDGYGFEFELQWDLTRNIELGANLAVQHSEDRATNNDVAYVPGLQLGMNMNWMLANGWVLSPEFRYIADRKRAEADPRIAQEKDGREQVKDILIENIVLRKDNIAGNLDFSFAIFNLADKRFVEPSDGQIVADYPMEGRSFRLQLVYDY